MRDADSVLVVMARYPTPGTVKTRLAARVGPGRACALYTAFLADLADRFAAAPWPLVWAVTPATADLSPIVGRRARQMAQEGTDLADRMHRCFVRLFADGAARVIMIGADAPHMGDEVIGAAFSALDAYDAVFVPTRDGGYCLIGMRAPHDVFSAVPMGTARVFEATRQRCAALGLRWTALAESFDVDELDDVADLMRALAQGPDALPRTAAVLRDWVAGGLLA